MTALTAWVGIGTTNGNWEKNLQLSLLVWVEFADSFFNIPDKTIYQDLNFTRNMDRYF